MELTQSLSLLQRYLTRQWNGDAALSEAGLSYSEFEYLSILQECHGDHCDMVDNDGPHLSELAEKMQLRKASVSTMIRKLEQKGLVDRVQCRYDARAQHILLTAQGADILEKAQAIYTRFAERLRKGMDDQSFQQLEDSLSKATSSLKKQISS